MHHRATLELRNGTLAYNGREPIQVTERQWKEFRTTLNQISVFQWQGDYPAPGIMGGTEWEIILRYPDADIIAQGTLASNDANPKGFEKFRKALEKLSGKRLA